VTTVPDPITPAIETELAAVKVPAAPLETVKLVVVGADAIVRLDMLYAFAPVVAVPPDEYRPVILLVTVNCVELADATVAFVKLYTPAGKDATLLILTVFPAENVLAAVKVMVVPSAVIPVMVAVFAVLVVPVTVTLLPMVNPCAVEVVKVIVLPLLVAFVIIAVVLLAVALIDCRDALTFPSPERVSRPSPLSDINCVAPPYHLWENEVVACGMLLHKPPLSMPNA